MASDSRLSLRGIHKRYGTVRALDGVSFDVEAGELLTILGPSGSGKTTLLKMVAGFEMPQAGSVVLGETDITEVPPARRNIGMVFQNYALFPHMTVAQNVAFPLRMRRTRKSEAAERVQWALDLVALGSYGERFPRQLSGGQQQRVALARAIVFNPSILLLDEPFGALDRKLREALQLEVKRLQRKLGLTTIFITHDQEEALILSDRIAVMNNGRVEQLSYPADIYERPNNSFVADFVGESNVFSGRVLAGGADVALESGVRLTGVAPAGIAPDTRVSIMIRPERLQPVEAEARGDNILAGEILEIIYLGSAHKYRLRTESGADLLIRMPAGSRLEGAEAGRRFAARVEPDAVHVLDLPGGSRT